MTRFTPLWEQAGSYAASMDRRLIGALWPSARCDGMAVSVDAGTTLDIQPGYASLPSANNTGSVLCASDAIEQLLLPAAPASGLSRVDVVIIHPRGADLDGGTDNDWIYECVQGAEASSAPPVPATPLGCLAIANVNRPGGSASIAPADITDVRPGSLAIPPPAAAEVLGKMAGSWTGPTGSTDCATSTPKKLIDANLALEAGTYLIIGGAQGAAVSAAPAWVNSSTGSTPGTYYYNFSVNAPNRELLCQWLRGRESGSVTVRR
jgi:hypothetical protein